MRPIDAHIAVEYIKNSDLPNHWKNALISCLLSIPTIAPPPNDPLTPEELLEMCGEPVWIDDWYEDFHGWELSETASDYFDGESRTVEAYGTRWVAYRRKPEEEK